MVQSAMTCLDGSAGWSLLSSCDVSAASVVTGLLDRFAEVGDPRRPGWVDHPVAAVLALCAGAVVAGMRSFTAIAGWVADVPAELLAMVYAGSAQTSVECCAIHRSTIRSGLMCQSSPTNIHR